MRVKGQRCDQVQYTDNTEKKSACDEVFCLHSPSLARHSLMSVHEICEKSYVALKESAAITLSTNWDLTIECLGVRAIEILDVRVATIVVRMMKRKVATSRFSHVDSAIPVLLAMLHRMVFALLSHSSERLENFRGGFEIFSSSYRSSLAIIIIAHQCDGALVPVPLVPGCAVGGVDRREVVQVSAIIFCPSMNFSEIFYNFRHSAI